MNATARSDIAKMGKKLDETENLCMEMEIEASTKAELKVALEELASNLDTISKFKKEVSRFMVTTDKMDKNLAAPPALPLCIGSG